MKNIKVFAMMLCIVTLGMTSSCSKDDSDLLVGKWTCDYYHVERERNGVIEPEYTETKVNLDITIEFTSNKITISNITYEDEEGVYTFEYKYKIVGDKLLSKYQGEDDTEWEEWTIENLTKKECQISGKESWTLNRGQDLEEETTSLHLKKL